MDIDVIMTGKPKSVRDRMSFIIDYVAHMEKETGMVDERVMYDTVSKKLEVSEDEVRRIIGQLIRDGVLYSPKAGFVRRASA
jgi:replicative DNA helicase Mcm